MFFWFATHTFRPVSQMALSQCLHLRLVSIFFSSKPLDFCPQFPDLIAQYLDRVPAFPQFRQALLPGFLSQLRENVLPDKISFQDSRGNAVSLLQHGKQQVLCPDQGMSQLESMTEGSFDDLFCFRGHSL